jgi:DNA polymerase-3 subunit epsilon
MTDFAAIDFETANQNHSSVCAVGIIIVKNSKIIDTYYSLIRPTPNYYLDWFTEEIHGISYNDTIEERPFPEVWPEIAPKIEGLTLVAHNSQFDEECLRAVHKVYKIPYPEYCFQCTCKASRRVFGKNLPDHSLPAVAKKCGFDFLNHHNALADAEACAVIAKKIL